MSYQAKNEIEHFRYTDCRIAGIRRDGPLWEMTLEALIVLPQNSQNTEFFESYATDTTARFYDCTAEKAVKDGFRRYDANGKLEEEEPDRDLTEEELETLLTHLKGTYLYDMQKIGERDGKQIYAAGIEFPPENPKDLAELTDSYQIRLSFSASEFTWKDYMNRA